MGAVSKNQNVELDYLRKQLYMTAMNCIAPQYRGDKEAVYACRDEYVKKLNKLHNDLSCRELKQVIGMIKEDRFIGEAQITISYSQRQTMNYYTIYLAIKNCDFRDFEITLDGVRSLAVNVRSHLMQLFRAKEALPSTILNYMYLKYINPLCNKWLEEGEFRIKSKNPQILYFQRLSKDEARYLLTRLISMYNQVDRRDSAEHVYDHNKN